MERKLYEILEDSNAPEDVIPSHEDGNLRKVNVLNINEIQKKGPSGHSISMHMYYIDTDESYYETYVYNGNSKTRESSAFYSGQICILRYINKEDAFSLNNIRKDATFTVIDTYNNDGKFSLQVITKDIIEKTKDQIIEFNYQKIDSQDDDLNYPVELILTNLNIENKSVKIKFTNKALRATEFCIAYRLADCDNNQEWNYVWSLSEEVELTNIEFKDYYVRVMYCDSVDNEWSFLSPEVLMNFY